jgi:hypothetical protein
MPPMPVMARSIVPPAPSNVFMTFAPLYMGR